MSNQLQITGGAKVRNLEGVLTGTSGVVSSLGINVPSGIPQLDGSGKILVSQLPNSVMEYKGTWNVATNTPYLVDGVGNAGDVYIVTGAATGGTTHDFGAGPILFYNGDQAIYDGSLWQRASGSSGTVTSVAMTTPTGLSVTGSPITTSGTLAVSLSSGYTIPTTSFLNTLVPYTGATQDVDLDTHVLNAQALHVKGTAGAGHLGLKHQSAAATGSANESLIYANVDGDLAWKNDNLYLTTLNTHANTADRTYTFPNASGTLALTSDLSAYVTLATPQTITGQKTFTTGIIGTTATFTTALDSGYSLQLKNSALNSNGVGFGVDSTYGNLFTTLKDGVAAARNLTLQNQGGYVSIDESGNFGVNILTPKGGVDIYQSTTASLYLHNSASGVSATDGVRLSLNASNANLRNYESGTLTMTSEGNFSVITASTENFRVNALDGSIYQSYVPNAMLKSVSGVLTAAVAGTDYVAPSALSGYVPTSRTLTINGTTYDLSANRSWSVGSVTSVGLSSATTGVTIGSSPITTSGTITLAIATASSTQQGLLSAADWTTFNSKQNAITNPVTGVGSTDSVAYWNSSSNITYDSTFYYSSSNKRLGVNTNTPNATIGANIAIDGGYGLLVKNADNNYNGLGIGIDSTYGNLIASQKLGTAAARNVTILNQSGYHSLTEAGSFGLNILTPTASPSGVGSVGIDVYGGSNAAGIGFHNVASGVGNTNGAYIYLTNALSLTLRNLEGSIVSSSLGDFSVITNSTENFRVNASTGSLWQSNITSAVLKANSSNVIVAAVAGTDYQAPITLTTTGSSGAATFSSNTLNVPNYTLSGLGGVPTSRTLTINGTAYDLSADRSWSVGTLTGGGADGRVAFWNGTSNVVSDSLFVWDDTNNRLGIGLVNPQRALEIYSASPDTHLRLSGAAPSVSMGEAITGSIYQAKFGLATANNQFVTGSVAGDFVINNQTGSTIWAYNSTEKMRLDTNGNLGVGGIANSSYRLHVFGTGTMLGIETTAASNVYLRMLQAGTVVGGMYYNNSDSTLRINNNNGGLRFDTSTVNGALSIASTGAATFSSSVTADSLVSNGGGQINTTVSPFVFYNSGGGGNAKKFGLNMTNLDGFKIYSLNDNGTTRKDNIIFANIDGNVGIGTSSPLHKLTIAAPSSAVDARSGAYIYSTDSMGANLGGQLFFGGSYTGTSETFWASIAGRKENATDNNVAGYLAFATRPAGGSNTERMRITSGGAVNVNSTQTSDRFSVTGSNNSTSIGLQGAGLVRTYYASAGTGTTYDAFRFLTESGGLYKQGGICGYLYMNFQDSGTGGNQVSYVYLIITTGNGVSPGPTNFTQISAGTVRGNNPVSSISLVNDGTGGGVKVQVTSASSGISGIIGWITFVGTAV